MIHDGARQTGREVRTAEVVVIGSGAGGAVAAATLAARGVTTILLEEGAHHPASSFDQRELTMIPRLFQEHGQLATSDQSILVMQGRALGGSTTHNTGLCVPIGEPLWRSWHAAGAAPCAYATFARSLEAVLAAIQARVADDDEINRNNRILLDGARALGLRHFIARHNRLRCSGCGYCTLGCAYNRKLSVVHAFLPAGIAAGLEVHTGMHVTRLEPGWTVTARSASGHELVVKAPRVILAAGAIRTPMMLARLGVRAGRTLRLHPFAPVGALFDEDVIAWRGVPQSVIIDDRLAPGGAGGYLLMVAAGQPAVTAAMTPAIGARHRQLMLGYPRMAASGVLLHDRAAGRVREGRDGTARIDYWPTRDDLMDLREGIRLLAELYFAQGAREIILPFVDAPPVRTRADLEVLDRLPLRPHSLVLASAHPQGSCPIAASPRQGPVAASLEVHGQPGLHVADASLFPTSLGLPPQVTTMAFGHYLGTTLPT